MNKSDDNAQQQQETITTLNTQDARRRHRVVTIELRKTKKEEENLKNLKRHNINSEYIKEDNGQSVPQQLSIDDIVIAMNSEDEARQFIGMQQARKMLSREGNNPPIDLLIEHGIVPICIRFLQNTKNFKLQFEAAWALTNIASGTSEQTRCVIDQDAVPHFITLMRSNSINLSEQAVWALGNIAGDGSAARDIVLQSNVIDGILPLIRKSSPISFLRNLVWLMSNLCRNKNPTPPFEHIKRLLPVLTDLLTNQDLQVRADACWALSYITDDDNNKIQAVIDTKVVPRLIELLDESDEPTVIVPALRTVGNIVTGTDQQTEVVIAAGGLSKLGPLMLHDKHSIVKEAAWAVSNIAAGNRQQIQAAIDAGVFEQIKQVLELGDLKAQKEAAWAITNTTSSGSDKQILDVIEKNMVLKPFMDLLDAQDSHTIKVVQTGISNLIAAAKNLGCIENILLMIEEMGGLEKLKALQQHENEEVARKAQAIIHTYYSRHGREQMPVQLYMLQSPRPPRLPMPPRPPMAPDGFQWQMVIRVRGPRANDQNDT